MDSALGLGTSSYADSGEHEASRPEQEVSWGVDMELEPVLGRALPSPAYVA